MSNPFDALAALEAGFGDMDQYVYVPSGTTQEAQMKRIADSILAHGCGPREVRAIATEPGFADIPLGETISGICLAKKAGTWLVYDPTRKTFYAFWGPSEGTLQAPRIEGGPIYCWIA